MPIIENFRNSKDTIYIDYLILDTYQQPHWIRYILGYCWLEAAV